MRRSCAYFRRRSRRASVERRIHVTESAHPITQEHSRRWSWLPRQTAPRQNFPLTFENDFYKRKLLLVSSTLHLRSCVPGVIREDARANRCLTYACHGAHIFRMYNLRPPMLFSVPPPFFHKHSVCLYSLHAGCKTSPRRTARVPGNLAPRCPAALAPRQRESCIRAERTALAHCIVPTHADCRLRQSQARPRTE